MVVEQAQNGVVRCTLPVTSIVQNSYGTLHGGAIGTLIGMISLTSLVTCVPLSFVSLPL
jgi:acyl-coenzyme A thioesterase PaaI-like protein